jgi:hypothetical protein
MRKVGIMLRSGSVGSVVLACALACAACGGGGTGAPSSDRAANAGSGASQGSVTAKLRVFRPDELLSQSDAEATTGHPVNLKADTLKVDPEMGMSATYYEYDLPGGTTLNAGLFVRQDSASSGGKVAEPGYDSDLRFVATDSKPIQGLGSKAFYQPSNSSLHVLVPGIYFTVAFEDKDSANNEELNVKLAKKVIANISQKR